jgi:hypothetical protein
MFYTGPRGAWCTRSGERGKEEAAAAYWTNGAAGYVANDGAKPWTHAHVGQQ